MTFDIDLGKVGITPGGEWNNDSSYERLTLVSKDGASYLSLMDNKGVEPGTNWNVWQLVAAKGTDGQDGADGEGGSGTPGDTIGVAYYSDGYLYWTKNGEWLLSPDGNMVRASAIDGGGDGGSSAGASFKSIVFKRSNTTPDTPTGGSFTNPVPTGWSDGIPSGETKLWMSARWFYSDNAMTERTTWSSPAQATDTADIDFEYSSIVSPGTPATNKSYWHNDGNTNDIWMAVRVKKNGVWGDWSVMKIKGEKGDDGEKGADAVAIKIIGAKDSVSELPSGYSGEVGDAYVVNGIIYVWDGDSWQNIGAFQGPAGTSNYIFVAYSNDNGVTLTGNNGTTPGKYWGYAIVNVNTRPLDASAYTWGKFQGDDGFGYEFIYMKTATATAPDIPESSNVDEYVPSGWSDDPYDVSAEYPYCWMCMRKKVDGVWGNYIGSDTNTGKAALFAKYGRDGVDGEDGISPNASYKSTAFIRSSAAVSAPEVDDTITDSTNPAFSGNYDNPVPYGWSDGIPAGTGKIWMTTRIFSSDGADPQQDEWSTPKVVSDTETMDYEWSTSEEPGVPSKSTPSATETNPHWADEPGDVDDPTQIKWMAQRAISNGAYVGEWLVMRVKGEKGEDGTSIELKGTKSSSSLLPTTGNTEGDAWLVEGDLWVWDGDSWVNAGHIQGEPGEDGATPYIHIKYSDDGGAHFTNNGGETPGAYIGIYWDYTSTDSANVSSYTWKKWVGEDGFGYEYIFKPTETGTAPNVPSGNNQTDDFVPAGWYDNPPSVSEATPYCWVCYRKKTGGVWSSFIGSSNNPSKAALWAHYGKDGVAGKGILSIVEMYAVNNDATSAPNAWTTTIPDVTAARKYLWNYEIINYTDGDSITTPPAVIGVYGTGRGISSIVEYYLASANSSGVTTASEGWSTNVSEQVMSSYRPFLWNYEVTTYNDGTTTTSDPVVIGHYGADGTDGLQGVGIDGVDEYYLATNLATGVTKNTTGWTTSVQTIDASKPYLWNYEVIHFSDNSVQEIQPCIIGHYGEDGEDGKGITSVIEHYLASSLANVTRATSGWTTAPQTISASAQYLWNYETINFSDGSHTDTDPVIIGVYGVATAVDDLAFLRGVFGQDNVSGESGAILRNLIGVTSPSDQTKVIAMLNASSIGEDNTHGKLLIAGGLNGLTSAGINAATFKVYADGQMETEKGVIGPFEITSDRLRTLNLGGNTAGIMEMNGSFLQYEIIKQGFPQGTLYIGKEFTDDGEDMEISEMCSITGLGQTIALNIAAGRTAMRVSQGAVEVANQSTIDLAGNSALRLTGNSTIKAFRTPLQNVSTANQTINLDDLEDHTVVIRQSGTTINLPESPKTGATFRIIAYTSGATLVPDNLSGIVTIGGGTSNATSAGASVSLAVGYCYDLLYNGTEWFVIKI